jgi:hypothetical protein
MVALVRQHARTQQRLECAQGCIEIGVDGCASELLTHRIVEWRAPLSIDAAHRSPLGQQQGEGLMPMQGSQVHQQRTTGAITLLRVGIQLQQQRYAFGSIVQRVRGGSEGTLHCIIHCLGGTGRGGTIAAATRGRCGSGSSGSGSGR